MFQYNPSLKPSDLSSKLDRMWAASADKIRSIEESWRPEGGALEGTPP